MKQVKKLSRTIALATCMTLGGLSAPRLQASPYSMVANGLEYLDPNGSFALRFGLTMATTIAISYKLTEIERHISNQLRRMGITSVTQAAKFGFITLASWKFWSALLCCPKK